jgi:predicted NAD-dependent protein-ADP-ribosyltransferase YbiA (DUF1768 family)
MDECSPIFLILERINECGIICEIVHSNENTKKITTYSNRNEPHEIYVDGKSFITIEHYYSRIPCMKQNRYKKNVALKKISLVY